MTFEEVDRFLLPWSEVKGLTLEKAYKGEEVRSLTLVAKGGKRYQLWVEPTDGSGVTCVHLWDYRKQHSKAVCRVDQLESYLEDALKAVFT